MKKIFAATILAGVILTACNKEDTIRVPQPHPKEQRIAIKLNNAYMPAAKIDSAIITWENGQVQQEKMQVSNDSLVSNIKNFTKGDGRLTVQLYTKTSLRQQNLQWEKRVDLTLKHDESITWPAPSDLNDVTWHPRVIMVDAPSKFTAIVALRPGDPYFLLKNVPAGYKIELERGYYVIPGGAISVGRGLWKCNTVCTDAKGIIENREYFSPLAEVNGKEWKMVEIGIGLFNNTPIPGPGFYFNHY